MPIQKPPAFSVDRFKRFNRRRASSIAHIREQLDRLGCSTPGCDHDHSVVFLHPSCHPDAGTWASYDKRTGWLTIECMLCGKPFVSVLVAADAADFRVTSEPADGALN